MSGFARPLGRAPLFDRRLLGPLIRALGGIPVHRRQDDPKAMHRNEDMFRTVVEVLHGGGAIQIYPEGKSHSEAGLAEFRTGAARIALLAEERADWRLGLSIVPVGITYSRKERVRTAAVVRFGRAFGCVDLREAYADDPVAAARRLTERIEEGIRRQTLNFERHRDRTLVAVAEQLYVRESRRVPWRVRERLGTRFPRLQRFARGLEWLREADPEEHRRLLAKVERYARLNEELRAGEGDVPPRFGFRPVTKYVLVRGALLALGLPFAVAGSVFWAPLARLPGMAVRRVRPELEVTATIKLVTLLTGVATAWVLWVVVGYLAGGLFLALAAAALAPLCGYVTIRWTELAQEVREDTSLFLRLQGRPDLRRRIAQLRRELTRTFRRLERRWMEEELPASGIGDNVSAPGADRAGADRER